MKNLLKNWGCIAEDQDQDMTLENSFLTQEEAQDRSKVISDVKYELALVLPKGELFWGSWNVNFTLTDHPSHWQDLFIDFEVLSCFKIALNNNILSVDSVRNERLYLPSEMLLSGKNRLEICYESKYKKTGVGLHKFIDPVDEEEYIYSQFAVFHAHKVFPCFDQPDIKAKMLLVLVTPNGHVVWSNSLEKEEKDSITDSEFCEEVLNEYNLYDQASRWFEGSYNITIFNSDLIMSTYLFAIISGPYDIHEKYETVGKNKEPIRMRVMCRKSIKQKAKILYPLIYEAIVTGMKWYIKFFGTEFPWEKYDQIFCPEFKYGAMENVGAVTISENYIPHDKLTISGLNSMLNTILHELCHQWFGNLWTMKWWDDLWLNEAFATYISYLWTDQNENLRNKVPGHWIGLNKRKSYAVNSDWLATTHSIAKKTPNTNAADDSLDSITYGKGSAFLKQLVHIIGSKSLSKTWKYYFKKYAWKNTTLNDFIDALSEGWSDNPELCDIDIKRISYDFLTVSGVNTAKASIKQWSDSLKI